MDELLKEELKFANKMLAKYEKLALQETDAEKAGFLKSKALLWSDIANQARAKLFA